MKGQLETVGRQTNRLPPPVVIRRKQIPLKSVSAKQQDSSVAESSISDEGARSAKEDSNGNEDDRISLECYPRPVKRPDQSSSRALSESETSREHREARRKWGFLVKSTSANGSARVFTDGGTTSTSSSSYDRDLQALSRRPAVLHDVSVECPRREAGTARGRYVDRISGSTSSDFQEESELSSEERDALIEGVRSPLTACRSRLTKFGARRRILATSSSAREHLVGGDRLLGLREDASSSSSAEDNIHASDEYRTEGDLLGVDLGSTKPTSAPTTLSLGRKITSWTKEGKDLLVKSVSSANTLAPTTMTCIKSPRAMSEHLLGQLEVPVTPAVLGALRVKGGSLKEGERSERVTDVPRQRWSSVRVKGGSTKSLLLENGGPQTKPLKGALTAEVFLVVD